MAASHRLRAPTQHEAILADPPREVWPELVEENRRRLNQSTAPVGGLPLHDLRRLARQELDLTPEKPLILSGHQPELFHPGVWVKNFALNRLARQVGGSAMNLIVNTDTMKSAALRFPIYGSAKQVRIEPVAYDAGAPECAYEGRTIHDPTRFRTFVERAEVAWKTWDFEPMLRQVWPKILAHSSPLIGSRFRDARLAKEHQWGCENLELTVSRFHQLESFDRFAAWINRDIERFQDCYNQAVRDYRVRNRIRNLRHPVPELIHDSDWWEAPFWRIHPDGRREPLMLRSREHATRTRPSPDVLHERQGIRPRALTLTLFSRLVLGDFFLHGIGGGKYDEVTDQIMRDYFGIEPPRYAVLSATLHLPLPHFPHSTHDAGELQRVHRDLYWNPQRHAYPSEQMDTLQREKAELIGREPTDHAARVERYHDLRAVTEQMRPLVANRLEKSERVLTKARIEARANEVLTQRDYSWVLYPEEMLREFMMKFL